MKKVLNLFLWLALASNALCATKFVAPGGSGNGSSWSSPGPPSIINSSAAGDVIYMAGGNYGGGIAVNASGSAGSPLTIKRATASDHGSDTGWNANMDVQAVFTSGWLISGKYVTVDGNCWKPPGLPTKFGISIKHASGTKGIDAGTSPGNLTVRDVDVIGPGYNASTSEADGIHFPDNSLITGCASHDTDALLFSWGPNTGSTIEYCLLYNASSIIVSTPGVGPHPDLWYTGAGANNSTVRWCFIANFVSEGFFFDKSGGTNMLWYGNLMIQGDTATGAVPIEYQNGGAFGTVFLYHNTFVDFGKGNNGGPGTTWASGSSLKNNLWINCGTNFTGLDNNGFSSGGAGSNAIVNAASPFVTSGSYVWKQGSSVPPATRVVTVPQGYNPIGMQTAFTLASNSWAAGKAVSVPSGMNVDMNGSSGNNLGAFQAGGAQPSPTPTVAPTATPAPKPTATPTPAPTATPVAPKFAVGDWTTPAADATVNVRSSPAGTAVGTHAFPDLGKILAGPTTVAFNGVPVQWYNIDWQTGVDGYSGDNDLTKAAAPAPTPTPTPTPIPSYHNWEAKLNSEMAIGVSASQLMSWITANPPTAD